MCNTEKMIDHSSLTPIIISLFRASLLFVALLSTFYAHFSFCLSVFSVLVVSSVLFLNIMFVCKKMTSIEKMVQPKKLPPENKVFKPKLLQNGDEKVLDQSQVTTDFTISNVFEPDLIFFDRLDKKSDKKFEPRPLTSTTLLSSSSSSSSLSLRDEACISEDAEEDYLIEIPLAKQKVELKERERENLERELLDLAPESVLQEQGLEDLNEIGGEDNLIEIDISMGSIRHSASGSGSGPGPGCEIRA